MARAHPWLHGIPPGELPAKARRLATLAQAGLPVPEGLVVPPDPTAVDDPGLREAIAGLLGDGPVVVRSALRGEDEAEGSAAGLGRSFLGCRDLAGVREALAAIGQQRDDPWLAAYHGRADAGADDRAIVQREVPRRALLVVAVPSGGPPELEVHHGAGEALAEGRAPAFAGRLAAWEDPARAEVSALVEAAVARLGAAAHGHDLELVVAPDDRPHLVQARPLTAPLHPGWPRFRAALEAAGQLEDLHGVLTLDAEHNPAPLSPAHAWLMGWLREQRPSAGDPTVLAGWLYVRTLPRDLARAPSSPRRAALPSALETVWALARETLPAARARLEALGARLAAASPALTADALPEALAAFLAMIDTYVGVLVPARTAARRAQGEAAAADLDRPLSTRGRAAFLDVLPATWDLASPSLADLGTTAKADHDALPEDEAAAATLLGEWDDHLFALGLAPLRRWHLRAAAHLGLGDEVFMLQAPELTRALRGDTLGLGPRIERRRAAHQAHATLTPPLRLEDGSPVARGRRARLRGLPLGASVTGTIVPRADLADLLRDPPPPDAIVIMPALTAPAAVALQQLGVRAICCEHGGALSHAALMARELGLSALIGCRGCTEIPAGTPARLDTTVGRLVLRPTTTTPT